MSVKKKIFLNKISFVVADLSSGSSGAGVIHREGRFETNGGVQGIGLGGSCQLAFSSMLLSSGCSRGKGTTVF